MKRKFIIHFVGRTYEQICQSYLNLKNRWKRVHISCMNHVSGPYFEGYLTVSH